MTPDEKRKAYYSQRSATRKAQLEMNIFTKFVNSADLQVDPGSAANEDPPCPDISAKVRGTCYLFELGRVADEDLASETHSSLRTGHEGEGGWFSEEEPLIRIIRKKAGRNYKSDSAQLDLVLYYDEQYPFAPADYLKGYEADFAKAMKPDGPFSRIWIYDRWSDSILWRRG